MEWTDTRNQFQTQEVLACGTIAMSTSKIECELLGLTTPPQGFGNMDGAFGPEKPEAPRLVSAKAISAEPHVIQTTRCAGNRDKPFHRPATTFHRFCFQKVVHSALRHVSYLSLPILLAGDIWDQITGRGSQGGATPVVWAGEG